jgi:hypothetical protein
VRLTKAKPLPKPQIKWALEANSEPRSVGPRDCSHRGLWGMAPQVHRCGRSTDVGGTTHLGTLGA